MKKRNISKRRKNLPDKQFFNEIREKKQVNSAFWFQKSLLWLQVSFGYNNPLNYGKVHSELFLLEKINKELTKQIKHNNIVFLGVGNGDTEMMIIDILLNKNNKLNKVIGVDVNEDFINLFHNSLEMRENELINSEKYVDFDLKNNSIIKNFEKLNKRDFKLQDNENKLICILGNTIGNYNDTDIIFKIFRRISNKGDQLLISYQKNTFIENIYKKYKENEFFQKFITHYLFLNEDDLSLIKWNLDYDNSVIEAFLDDIQIFRSKKFTDEEVIMYAKNNGFTSIFHQNDDIDNLAIHLFEKL